MAHPRKILFIDKTHPLLIEKLKAKGFECIVKENIPKEQIIKDIHEFFGLIVRSRVEIDKELLKHAKNLKFIGRSGAGLESIDIDFAEKKGILVFNSPEGNRDAVGEHAVGMILSLMNNLNRADREVKKGEWDREKNRGHEIKGKTIGIIGYGNMGSCFAKKISGFDVQVLAYDKYKTGFSSQFVRQVSLNELFKMSDIISLHVPLTQETKYLVDSRFITKVKKPFYLINTSRGPVVNTIDLVEGLKSGKVLGACLDVIEYEEVSFEKLSLKTKPIAFKFLIKQDNVILSPHIAGWTYESKEKLALVLAEKIIMPFHPRGHKIKF